MQRSVYVVKGTQLSHIFALGAGSLGITHPHQMVVWIAQTVKSVRLCLDHLHSRQFSNLGYLSLSLPLMQMALMQLIPLLDHTQATVQSTIIRVLVAILHLTCILQHCSSPLQQRMTGACLPQASVACQLVKDFSPTPWCCMLVSDVWPVAVRLPLYERPMLSAIKQRGIFSCCISCSFFTKSFQLLCKL